MSSEIKGAMTMRNILVLVLCCSSIGVTGCAGSKPQQSIKYVAVRLPDQCTELMDVGPEANLTDTRFGLMHRPARDVVGLLGMVSKDGIYKNVDVELGVPLNIVIVNWGVDRLSATPAQCKHASGGERGAFAGVPSVKSEARISGARQPIRFIERPLTLPGGTASLDPSFSFTREPGFGGSTVGAPPALKFADVFGGAAYGISDDLEVGAVVLPILLSPDLRFGNPSLFSTYRLTQGSLETGVTAAILLPVSKGSDVVLTLGAPVLLRLGSIARLDTGLLGTVQFADDHPVLGLTAPFELSLAVVDALTLRATTRLRIFDLGDVGGTLRIPLGFGVVYAIEGTEGPVADIGPEFEFPSFLAPAADDGKVSVDFWRVFVAARLYLYL